MKADQNNIQVRYANIKQQPGESISEYKRRIVNILDSFSALKLAKPSDADVATKFLFGVDDQRYESLKICLGNEAANDRELYPTTLDGAATQATKWVVHKAAARDTRPSMPVFPAIKEKKASKLKIDTPPTPNNSNPKSNDTTCSFCSRTGHKMEECYKFIASSKTASEKSKAPRNKGRTKPKTVLVATDTEDHASTAEPEAYMSGYYAYSINVTRSKLTAWDLILDTGASGSIINNKDLLQNVKKMKRSVTFGGIVVLYCTYSTYVPYSLSPYRVLNSDTASALEIGRAHV